MSAMEVIREGMEAVAEEIASIRTTGPLITRDEAERLATLMRLISARISGEIKGLPDGRALWDRTEGGAERVNY